MDTADVVNDVHRLAALRDSGLLDAAPQANLDRITGLAERLLDVPVAMVSLVDRGRQFFTSQRGLPSPWAEQRQTPLSHSFCQYAVASGEPLVVNESRTHALVADNPAIEDLGAEAYAGTPLTSAGGEVLGTLCVIEHEPREWLPWELEVLADLAALAITEIDFRIRTTRLQEVAAQVARLTDPIEGVEDAVQSLVNVADRAGDPRVERLASLSRERLAGLRATTGAVREALSAAAPDLDRIGTGAVNLGERLLRAARLVSVASPDADLRIAVLHRPLTVEGDAQSLERRIARLLAAVVEHADDAVVEAVADRDAGHAVLRITCERPIPVAELTRIATLAHAVRSGDQDADASLSTSGGTSSAALPAGRATTGRDGTEVLATVPLRAEPDSGATDAA